MKSVIVRVFDFDETLTCKHTFYAFQSRAFFPQRTAPESELKEPGFDTLEFQLRRELLKHTINAIDKSYKQGQLESQNQLKTGLKDTGLFEFNEYEFFAIATFHDNPHFIQGMLEGLIGAKVTLQTDDDGQNHEKDRIMQFSVAGVDVPFLVVYKSPVIYDASVDANMLAYCQKNKNSQLDLIQQRLLSLGIIDIENKLEFFDDSTTNCEHAKRLPFISNVFQVTTEQTFTITPYGSATIPFTPQTNFAVARQILQSLGIVASSSECSRVKAEQMADINLQRPIFRESSIAGNIAITYKTQEHGLTHGLLSDLVRFEPPVNVQEKSSLISFIIQNFGGAPLNLTGSNKRDNIFSQPVSFFEAKRLIETSKFFFKGNHEDAEKIASENEGLRIIRASKNYPGTLEVVFKNKNEELRVQNIDAYIVNYLSEVDRDNIAPFLESRFKPIFNPEDHKPDNIIKP